jgi:signal transduction histidine kinase
VKIRDKLFLSFGLYILLAVILGFFAYKELRTISTRLVLVETADDITNTILEVRRYEKNFLLFKDHASFAELEKYLDILKKNIDEIGSEIVAEIGSENAAMMKTAINEYERLVRGLADNFTTQQEQENLVRIRGRAAERVLVGADLQAFLVLRRYEKNVMLYKKQDAYALFNRPAERGDPAKNDAYAVFQRAYAASSLSRYAEVRGYRVLVSRLYGLYEAEKTTTDRMRITARDIQSFIQNLAKKERANIATTIKMSINLQVVALVLVVIAGTVVNIKLATSIASPIRELERITKKITRGDFSESITVEGHDEIASLAGSYNQMEEKLEHAMGALEEIIKKLKEKQDQLVEAEKLAAVGKLAAGIAHEINNPLTAVLTFSNLMLEQCPEGDPRREKLKLMARETERARNIVRQLLNFGRETVIRPERININRPVSEILESLVAREAYKGIELSVRLAEDLPEIDADPAAIGQVTLNMLLNAIHAVTPPGQVDVSTRLQDGKAGILFKDSGSGIPDELLHKIFDPFVTTKDAFKGTGLGLAVSYGIVKKHGGEIDVASAVGKGTTFTVRLPIHG